MPKHQFFALALTATSLLSACGNDDASTADASNSDAGTTDLGTSDAANTDSGATDAALDATADAGEYVPDWSCVGGVTWPAATTETVFLTGEILDAVTDAPIAGVAATICADRNDTDCADGIAAGPSGADGLITASLNTGMGTGGNGFFGYFRLAKEGYVDVFAFTYRPLSMELPTPPTERLFSPAAITVASTMIGVTQSEENGILIVRVRDCAGQYAAGADVSLGGTIDGSTQFYANGDVLELATSESVTDSSGIAGFANVMPGSFTVTAAVAGIGTIGRMNAFVAADTMSHMYLGPTPLGE